jgi:hypothetical protein
MLDENEAMVIFLIDLHSLESRIRVIGDQAKLFREEDVGLRFESICPIATDHLVIDSEHVIVTSYDKILN